MIELKTNNLLCIDFEVFKSIFDELKTYLNSKDFKVREINIDNYESYNQIKSYRSSVTEGNTTTVGDFTKLMLSEDLKKKYAPTYDEQNEILNLIKVYSKSYKFKKRSLSEINYILGDEIFKNNFLYYRGKFRNEGICYINFKRFDERYRIEFTKNSKVINMIDELFKNINNINCEDNLDRFILAMITHNELLSIHPFVDGNGRTIRAFIEKYLEDKEVFPFIPFSNHKKSYQDAMGDFHIDKQTDYKKAYIKFFDYILSEYNHLCDDVIEAMQKLEKSKES